MNLFDFTANFVLRKIVYIILNQLEIEKK